MEKTHNMKNRSDHQPPALVLYLLTDQQALWTVSGIYRLARRGGEASLSATADFGWREPPVATPHHDRLLREGAFFANFHVSGLWCVPSRGALMTSRSVSRLSRGEGGPGSGAEGSSSVIGGCLHARTPTMGAAFRAAGYATAYVGKWHLAAGCNSRAAEEAAAPEAMPRGTNGFDHTRHMLALGHYKTLVDVDEQGGRLPSLRRWQGGSCSRKPVRWLKRSRAPSPLSDTSIHLAASMDVPCGEGARAHYYTRAAARWAGRLIEESLLDARRSSAGGAGKRRLFLVLSLADPHQPYATLPEAAAPFAAAAARRPQSSLRPAGEALAAVQVGARKQLHPPHDRAFWEGGRYRDVVANYLGMVALIDEALGELSALALRVGNSTLTVVNSDHGEMLGAHAQMGKGTMYDGALRAPLLVHWPGRVAARRMVGEMACSLDVWPTLAGLIGLPALRPAATDGVDMHALLLPARRRRGVWARPDVRIIDAVSANAQFGTLGVATRRWWLSLEAPASVRQKYRLCRPGDARCTKTALGAPITTNGSRADASHRLRLEEMGAAGLCRLWDRAADPTQQTDLCARPEAAGVVRGLLRVLREHLEERLPGHPALTAHWFKRRLNSSLLHAAQLDPSRLPHDPSRLPIATPA